MEADYVDHHKRYVAVADELLGYDVKKLIRILKAWNHLRGYQSHRCSSSSS